jgi:hypothetical protein
VPWPNQDIVAQLQTLGNPSPIILSRAILGQASTVVMGLKNQEQYFSDITTGSWITGKPDAILVSAGGETILQETSLSSTWIMLEEAILSNCRSDRFD